MKRRITLQISILSIYVSTFIILITTLMTLSTYYFSKSILYTSEILMTKDTHSVLRKLTLAIEPTKQLIKLSKSLIEENTVTEDELFNYTFNVAKNSLIYDPTTYSYVRVAWADTKGNSIRTFLQPNGVYSTLIIDKNPNHPKNIVLYRDQKGQIIKTETLAVDYNPLTRDWYEMASKSQVPVWTNAFISFTFHELVTSLSTPIFDNNGKLRGVFSISLPLQGLSNFLSNISSNPNSISFIIDSQNNLLAFPGLKKILSAKNTQDTQLPKVESLEKPWLNKAIKLHQQNNLEYFNFYYNNVLYLASFRRIPEFSTQGWMTGIVIPADEFIGPLRKISYLITVIGLVILLLGILIASFFSRKISNPIKSLVTETNKIKEFNLEGDKAVYSIIKEVDLLSSAIYSMKINLRSFQKYLPSALVRQLIRSGKDIQLGGSKKQLTIFFSDIKNFTSLSETADPDEFLFHLCEYLDELSKIISQEKGTIDKYIGDSIMAFWGAPLADKEHCFHACHAALKCKARLRELNESWLKQNKPSLVTRIGIHTGTAIVGNIGSSERLNYTAIGDSINFASRLEQLNKDYGTMILVSEDVIELIKDRMLYRLIDCIPVRGKVGNYRIYELLAENQNELSFDLTVYQLNFEKGFKAYQNQEWQEAIRFFRVCLEIYPEDTVAPVFIMRCESGTRLS